MAGHRDAPLKDSLLYLVPLGRNSGLSGLPRTRAEAHAAAEKTAPVLSSDSATGEAQGKESFVVSSETYRL